MWDSLVGETEPIISAAAALWRDCVDLLSEKSTDIPAWFLFKIQMLEQYIVYLPVFTSGVAQNEDVVLNMYFEMRYESIDYAELYYYILLRFIFFTF